MADHLTLAERKILYVNLKGKSKKSKTEIAATMGRHRSTIYRELKRNAGLRG